MFPCCYPLFFHQTTARVEPKSLTKTLTKTPQMTVYDILYLISDHTHIIITLRQDQTRHNVPTKTCIFRLALHINYSTLFIFYPLARFDTLSTRLAVPPLRVYYPSMTLPPITEDTTNSGNDRPSKIMASSQLSGQTDCIKRGESCLW